MEEISSIRPADCRQVALQPTHHSDLIPVSIRSIYLLFLTQAKVVLGPLCDVAVLILSHCAYGAVVQITSCSTRRWDRMEEGHGTDYEEIETRWTTRDIYEPIISH